MSTQMKSHVLLPSTTITAATTGTVGDWFDVSDCDELYAALNVTAFAAVADETLVVTIERYNYTTTGYVAIATFTTISTSGVHNEEKTVTSLIGGRIRVRYVAAGTWSSKSLTFEVKCLAKQT